VPYKSTGRAPGRPPQVKQSPTVGQKPKLTKRQWKALRTEHRFIDWSRVPWPSRASLRKVGLSAGASHEAVRQWRQNPSYGSGLIWLEAEKLIRGLRAEKTARSRRHRSKRQANAAFHVYLKNNWSGPIVSPLDGKTYDNADDYFHHLQDHPDIAWAGDTPTESFISEEST
jgi:hypothetical protein